MSQRIRVFALGGLDENGKCLFVLEIDRDLFVIESGLKYPDYTIPESTPSSRISTISKRIEPA
jgi:mRNA degradation ribonuclease J1/J2